MTALTEFLFAAPASRSTTAIIAWWERRRLAYNACVGAAGLVSLGTVGLAPLGRVWAAPARAPQNYPSPHTAGFG